MYRLVDAQVLDMGYKADVHPVTLVSTGLPVSMAGPSYLTATVRAYTTDPLRPFLFEFDGTTFLMRPTRYSVGITYWPDDRGGYEIEGHVEHAPTLRERLSTHVGWEVGHA